jgi:hypothetical protein
MLPDSSSDSGQDYPSFRLSVDSLFNETNFRAPHSNQYLQYPFICSIYEFDPEDNPIYAYMTSCKSSNSAIERISMLNEWKGKVSNMWLELAQKKIYSSALQRISLSTIVHQLVDDIHFFTTVPGLHERLVQANENYRSVNTLIILAKALAE